MDKRTLAFPAMAAVVAVLLAAAAGHGYAATLMTWMAIAALAASSLRFVLLIGELNFAVAGFYGIGAYASSLAATVWGWPFAVALPLAAGAAVAVSLVFGFVTLRTKGPYFLLIGFAFTEVLRIVYTRSSQLGGNSGMVGMFPPDVLQGWFHVFAVAVAAAGVLILYAIEHSHIGRVFTAIRDNENVVRSVGIHAHAMKLLCFCIACGAAGLAGALHAFANNVISPGDFGFLLSAFVLAYLKVGGEDHAAGPVVGAVLMVLLGSVAQSFGGSEHIFYGAGIVLAVLFMPRGLVGWLSTLSLPGRRNSARPRQQAGESV